MKRCACIFLLLVAVAAGSENPDPQPFDYDRKATLDVREVKAEDRDGVLVRDISYASPKSGRANAYLAEPEAEGGFAAVIYGHWCMPGSPPKNRTEFLPESAALAHGGVISLLPDCKPEVLFVV